MKKLCLILLTIIGVAAGQAHGTNHHSGGSSHGGAGRYSHGRGGRYYHAGGGRYYQGNYYNNGYYNNGYYTGGNPFFFGLPFPVPGF
jgi:hypothetical protein